MLSNIVNVTRYVQQTYQKYQSCRYQIRVLSSSNIYMYHHHHHLFAHSRLYNNVPKLVFGRGSAPEPAE